MEKSSELSVLPVPNNLSAHYDKLVLIAHADQLDLFDVRQPGTLIVSTDWLAWRKCVDRGGHGLHFESMLGEWPTIWSDADEHHRVSCEWMYSGGEDITLFRGVSLGKQFNKDIVLLCRAYIRLWSALDRICQRFTPVSMEYYQIRAEYGRLDGDMRHNLVQEVADKNGIQLIDRRKQLTARGQVHPDLDYDTQVADDSWSKDVLRRMYENTVHSISCLLGAVRGRRPKTFLLLNWQALSGLLKGCDGKSTVPVLTARHWPKSFRFVVDCWRRGVFLTKLPSSKLTRQEAERVDEICVKIQNVIARPDGGLERARASFIRDKIIAAGRLHKAAGEVRAYDLLLRRHNIDQILVGDAENATCRLLAELGHHDGRRVYELLNGLFMTHQYFDVRSGDEVHSGYIDCLLSWGAQNDSWLGAKNTEIKSIRTGYPALANFSRRNLISNTKGHNALVLPMSMEGVVSLHANIFATLVDTVHTLRELGYSSIRIKVHLGHPNKAYFDQVNKYFGLGCAIFQEGQIDEHLDWADIVVGPVNSGAFVETLMFGKPYYPMRTEPSSLRSELFCGVHPIGNAAELKTAILNGDHADPDLVLENYCSVNSIPDPSRRVWEVLAAEAEREGQSGGLTGVAC